MGDARGEDPRGPGAFVVDDLPQMVELVRPGDQAAVGEHRGRPRQRQRKGKCDVGLHGGEQAGVARRPFELRGSSPSARTGAASAARSS